MRDTWLLEMPERLHQVLGAPGGDAFHVRLLDHREQRLLGATARLEEGRQVRVLAQLRDAQVDRAGAGVSAARAIAVAVGRAVRRVLVEPGADLRRHIGVHDGAQHGLQRFPQEVGVGANPLADDIATVHGWGRSQRSSSLKS